MRFNPFKRKPKYARRNIGEWYGTFRYHFNTSYGPDLSEVKLAIAQSEKLKNNPSLTRIEIEKLLLTTKSISTLCLCIYSTAFYETHSSEVTNKLIDLLKDEDELVRRFSAEGLLQIGSVEALSAVVGGNNHGCAVRTKAAWTLEKLGENAIDATHSLLTLIKDQDINWRSHFAAAHALASLGPEVKEILLTNLQSEDQNLRYYSAYALSILKPKPVFNNQIAEILEKDK